MKPAERKMLEHIREDIAARFQNMPPERLRLGVAGNFLEEEQAEAWTRMAEEAFPGLNVFYDPLTFSVGCHVGPGAAGIGISVSA